MISSYIAGFALCNRAVEMRSFDGLAAYAVPSLAKFLGLDLVDACLAKADIFF